MALQAAADELYGLPPEQFTAARDDFAKRLRQAGERDLASAVRDLRRPSMSAWLVNVLVRHRAEPLDELLEIGELLRSAMASGAGLDVRRLTEDRRGAVAALASVAEVLAGRSIAAGVLDEVRATLEAATADPTAATAVCSGRLVRALSYAGFGELPDLAGAVGLAGPAPSARLERKAEVPPAAVRTPRVAKATIEKTEQAAYDAAGRADDAQRSYEQRLADHAQAVQAVEDARTSLEALRQQLTAATAALGATRDAERSAVAATEAARRAASQAHAAAAAARQRLSKARAAPSGTPLSR